MHVERRVERRQMSMTEKKRKELLEQFREWIRTQQNEKYQMQEIIGDGDNPDCIRLETADGFAEVSFYPLEIIQLSVLNHHIDHHVFFLHFQMHDLAHAQELFEEMAEALLELEGQPTGKVLLCCSSGLTTGYFAEKLNETVKMLNLPFDFHAVSYNLLYKNAGKYDVVLLAPQIAYVYDQAKEILAHRHVLQIPPKIFASYDVMAVLEMIRPYLQKEHDQGQVPKLEDKATRHGDRALMPDRALPMRSDIRISCMTLTIGLIRENDDRFHFASRVYDQNMKILYDADVVKTHILAEDFCDICDTALARFPQVEMIGIALPGIINKGVVTVPSLGIVDVDLVGILESRFGKKVRLENDANSIVAGYYATQTEYASISLLFQPVIGTIGGVGSISKGHLIEGRNHVAGEVQYLPGYKDRSRQQLWGTPEGALQLATETMASIISILGPELVILSSHMVFRAESIRRELTKFIPEQYIPDIRIVKNLREYMLIGMVSVCAENE